VPVTPRHAPVFTRLASLLPGRVLRLDIHPADFEHPRMAAALEAAMRRAGRRTAVTYDELAGLMRAPVRPAPRRAPRHT
jgi:hypothetical protein